MPRSKEFIDGVHYFLRVAEANKRDGFMCCPCALCKNSKEYSSSRSLHSHLLKSSFMSNYICWTKHGEIEVIIEEGEEEQLDPDDIIAQYSDFDDTAMGEAEEEVGQKTHSLKMTLLVISFVMHKEIAKVKMRRLSLTAY
jgi:hypothetical protein